MTEYIEICSLRNLREAIDLIESAVAKRQGFDPEETAPDDVMYSIREDIQKWADGDDEDHYRSFRWSFTPPRGRCRKMASICLNVDIQVMESPAPICKTQIKGEMWWEPDGIQYRLFVIDTFHGDIMEFIMNGHSYEKKPTDIPGTRVGCLYRIKNICCDSDADKNKRMVRRLVRAYFKRPYLCRTAYDLMFAPDREYSRDQFNWWWRFGRFRAYQLCSAYKLEKFYVYD